MSRKLLSTLALFTLFAFAANAQLKLGDNPTSINSNSVLEMESANKGMLLPRVALTGTASATPLSAHEAGMVVYNTATAADVTPGYYYDDGTQWVRLAEASSVSAPVWGESSGMLQVTTLADGITPRPTDAQITITDDGNLGLGTTSTTHKLKVNGNMMLNGSVHIASATVPNHTETPSTEGTYIKWNDPVTGDPDPTDSDPKKLYGMTSFINNKGTGVGGFIFTNTADGVNYTPLMRILASGSVGIGTSTPGSKLSVIGLPVFADNAAAASLSEGDFYRTPTGAVMVKY